MLVSLICKALMFFYDSSSCKHRNDEILKINSLYGYYMVGLFNIFPKENIACLHTCCNDVKRFTFL